MADFEFGGEAFRGIRYSSIMNEWGPGGALIVRPARVFEARFVVFTAANGIVRLYDHTRYPQNPLMVMNAGGGLPDIAPRQPITLPLQLGLYASFSMGTGVMGIFVAWDRA